MNTYLVDSIADPIKNELYYFNGKWWRFDRRVVSVLHRKRKRSGEFYVFADDAYPTWHDKHETWIRPKEWAEIYQAQAQAPSRSFSPVNRSMTRVRDKTTPER